MDSRSIDVAKTASIDMMSLNNKVVKMRPIVKRSKAQIVNRLCRHITALKKKKGTEAQKEKNIRKAERLIEEIESIRRLKEDKVSKYSLANTSTFESISKSTLSSNMRALARLADHHLMKEVVNDFRQKHNDWRDLAAFLLVKQTGRKFKTKKQKQKKLAQRVENINASETMTKAYIEERFGKEGLEKAEQRFQKKRKKGKGVDDGKETQTQLPEVEKDQDNDASHDRKDTQTGNSVSSDDKINKTDSETGAQDEGSTSVENEGNKSIDEDVTINVVQNRKEKMSSVENKNTSQDSSIDNKEIVLKSRLKRNGEQEADSEGDDSGDGESESENNESDEEEDEDSEEKDQALRESEDSDDANSERNLSDINEESDKDNMNNEEGFPQKEASVASNKSKTPSNSKPKSDECVVKKLKIGASSDEDEEEEEEDDDEVSAEDADDIDMEDDSNSLESKSDLLEVDDDDSESHPLKKRKAQKESKTKKSKLIPEFLTKRDHVLKNTPNDPFFVGSDGEEGDDDDDGDIRNTAMDFDVNNDDYYDDRGSWSGKGTTKSMFYEPGAENLSGRRFEKKNFASGFKYRGRGHAEYRGRGRSLDRSRGFRGRGRGSFHSSNRGRGRETKDDGERRVFKFGSGSSRDEKRGSFSSRGSSHWGKGSTQKPFQKFGASSSKDSGPVSTTVSDTAEKLHPSWEASRKRKAEQSGLKAFEGTKIVFDDD